MSFIVSATTTAKMIMILMHGYGTSASDFIPISEFFARKFNDIEIHVLDGFYELDSPTRRKWFNLESDNIAHWRTDIKPAGKKLALYIKDVLKKHDGLTMSDVMLAGFSQGAMMALHVGLAEQVGGVISFSGALVDESVATNNTTTQILLIHGDCDDVISLKDMQESCRVLYRNNIPCSEYIEHELTHSISLGCLEKASEFIEKRRHVSKN